ncbi:hypothetical protein [Streptomyces sp. B27]|uniref:hypothetical protein n=1 Tax=Streptomyces sp. B27 TaxID=2485015 RepID=UPI000FDB0A34|nr:hypothetical protein [Streptomyces sp. B27]
MTDTTPTPADRPADQLRAAAEKLREEAARAHRASPAPWTVTDEHVVRCADGMVVADRSGTDHPAERADLPYIALVHPGVGLALADWLERAAVNAAVLTWPNDVVEGALAVARQLLGTTEGESAGAVLEPQDHPGADLFVALRAAGLDVDEANRRIHAYAGMVLRQEKALAAPPAPADRAAVLNETADRIQRRATQLGAVYLRADQVIDAIRRIADEKTEEDRLADDAAAGVQPPTSEADTEAPEDAARRFARRLHAVELLCSGRPGYHTITVKALLTAMGEADDEQPAAPAAPEEQR